MAKRSNNLAASVRQRLLNLSRQQGRIFEVVLVTYGLERLLYRLSVSEFRDRFILKGGLLVTFWIEGANRVTRDADFLGHGDASEDHLKSVFATILSLEADDGLVYDFDGLAAETIREEHEYGGIRLKTTAYPPAAVVAEKLQVIVVLGLANSRMKDYYDLWAILNTQSIGTRELDAAMQATFERRRTDIPKTLPIGLSGEFVADDQKARQWAAYSDSIGLESLSLDTVVETIWSSVGPSCERLNRT